MQRSSLHILHKILAISMALSIFVGFQSIDGWHKTAEWCMVDAHEMHDVHQPEKSPHSGSDDCNKTSCCNAIPFSDGESRDMTHFGDVCICTSMGMNASTLPAPATFSISKTLPKTEVLFEVSPSIFPGVNYFSACFSHLPDTPIYLLLDTFLI